MVVAIMKKVIVLVGVGVGRGVRRLSGRRLQGCELLVIIVSGTRS